MSRRPPPSVAISIRGRAGIERVLDQFLDDARRPLDHLARGDAVDEGFGKLADGHLGFQFGLPVCRAGCPAFMSRCAPRAEGLRVRRSSAAARVRTDLGLPPQFLMSERRFLPSRRRCLEALVGLVARRGIGRTAASWISSTSRSQRLGAVALLGAMRCARHAPARRPWSGAGRRAHQPDRRRHWAATASARTSKRSCTAVESLLTFCPPGPEERTKLFRRCSDASVDADVCR